MAESTEDLREKVATSCRILGMMGLFGMNGTLGHVSARSSAADEEMFMTCGGPGAEDGLRFLTVEAVRRMDFDGQGPDLSQGHHTRSELPIHGEIYKVRPEVGCVIHAHPPALLLCGLAGIEFRAVFDSYDPACKRIAVAGVPVFPRARSVTTREAAAAMIETMGRHDVVLMKGHGVAVTGKTVEEATDRAIAFERLARLMWQLALMRCTPPEIDLSEPLRERVESGTQWRQYVRLLEEGGPAPTQIPMGIEDIQM